MRTQHYLAAAPILGSALAGFNSGSSSNIVVYAGQNSANQANSQGPLADYCQNSDIDVIPLAFVTMINGQGGVPEVNFANWGNNCTTFSGTNLLDCPQLGSDIKTCQGLGKQVTLSIGGATYTEGGFSSSDAANAGAQLIWNTFGGGSSNTRPFGDAVVDGFDFDFESTVNNMVPFGQTLRSLMDADSSKPFLLTAAPQCPFPDAADGSMLAGQVFFDAVLVQFYNNYCGVQSYVAGASSQNNFNFATWDNWAKTSSKNPNVKVLLGVPASGSAAGSGYEDAGTLGGVINYCKGFSSFGGVMMWDASQAYANSGFLSGVASDLGRSSKRTGRSFVA